MKLRSDQLTDSHRARLLALVGNTIVLSTSPTSS